MILPDRRMRLVVFYMVIATFLDASFFLMVVIAIGSSVFEEEDSVEELDLLTLNYDGEFNNSDFHLVLLFGIIRHQSRNRKVL